MFFFGILAHIKSLFDTQTQTHRSLKRKRKKIFKIKKKKGIMEGGIRVRKYCWFYHATDFAFTYYLICFNIFILLHLLIFLLLLLFFLINSFEREIFIFILLFDDDNLPLPSFSVFSSFLDFYVFKFC